MLCVEESRLGCILKHHLHVMTVIAIRVITRPSRASNIPHSTLCLFALLNPDGTTLQVRWGEDPRRSLCYHC